MPDESVSVAAAPESTSTPSADLGAAPASLSVESQPNLFAGNVAVGSDDDDVFGHNDAPAQAAPPALPKAGASSPPQATPTAPPATGAPAAPSPDKPPADASSAFDDALEMMGEQLGLTKDEVRSLGTGDTRYAGLRLIAKARQALQAQGDQPGVQQPPQVAVQAPAQPPAQTEKPPYTLDPTIVDESVIAAFDGMHSHYAKESKAHRAEVQQLTGMVQQLQAALGRLDQERTFDTLESYISSLGDDWRDVYGDKPFREMEPGSPGYTNAMHLLREAAGESFKVRALNPNATPRVRTLLEKAHAALHGKRIAERAQKRVVDQIRDAAGRFTAAPNGRPKTDTPNEEPGAAAARKFLKARGVQVEDDLD